MDVIIGKKHKHYDGKFYWLLEDQNQVYVYIGQKDDCDEIKPIRWVYKERFLDVALSRAIALRESKIWDIALKLGLMSDLSPELEKRYEEANRIMQSPRKGRLPSLEETSLIRELVWVLTHYLNGKAAAEGQATESDGLPFSSNRSGMSILDHLEMELHKSRSTLTEAYTFQNSIFKGEIPQKWEDIEGEWKDKESIEQFIAVKQGSLRKMKKFYFHKGYSDFLNDNFSMKDSIEQLKETRKVNQP